MTCTVLTPEGRVTDFERHIEGIELPDSDDWHVVAPASRAADDYVVTFNLRDFPRQALELLAIQAIHLGEFISDGTTPLSAAGVRCKLIAMRIG